MRFGNRLTAISLAFLLTLFLLTNFVSAQNCEDSDGHLTLEESYYVKGHVHDKRWNRYYYDSCFFNYVREQICSYDMPSSRTFSCPQGCGDGACIGGIVCTDTCQSLGYECGTHTVCDASTDCGTCSSGYECVGGQCEACVPDCAGKECGDDGCGGSCGDCGSLYGSGTYGGGSYGGQYHCDNGKCASVTATPSEKETLGEPPEETSLYSDEEAFLFLLFQVFLLLFG